MDGSSSKTRRAFLKQSSYAGIGLIGLRSFSIADIPNDETRSLTVLHTNDMHSHIDPFPDDDPRYPGQGGMAERAHLIDRFRAQDPHLLLLDAGDIFQGTPYFNYFGGALEFELMSKMGYDAATMGNHDFDGGMDGFEKALDKADFPFICSNYDFTDSILEGKTIENKIIRRNGIRIGIFGLGVELDGLVDPRLYKGVRYLDPITVAHKQVEYLQKERKCDLVICLSHLGYSYEHAKVSDRVIADSVGGIDFIIGGHTHTFLERPEAITKSEKHTTYINQVGWAGVKLGAIQFNMSKEEKESTRAMRPLSIGNRG
jgi:5'-nucleotidase